MLSLALVLLLVSSCAALSISRLDAQSPGCGHVNKKILHSPGYPHNYPPSTHCVYTIPLEKNKALKIKFLHFDMEFSSNCSYDFVEVKDNEVSYGKYCGNTLAGDEMVIDDTPTVYIVFKSDNSISKSGFEIKFEEVSKGHDYGGHEVETVTFANTEATPKPTTPFQPTSHIDNIDTSLPPTTGANQYNPSTRGEISESIYGSFRTNEATPEVSPTNEATPEVFSTNEATPDVFPTHEATPDVFPTHEGTPDTFPTHEGTPEVFPTHKATPDVFPTNEPNENTTLEPLKATVKRQMKLKIPNDDSEDDSTAATHSEPSVADVKTTATESLGNESLPTQVPVGNESIASGNATVIEVAPTEEEEVTEGHGDVMNNLHSTVEPEPTRYKPEPERHVLDKLKLIALIQRIKFATLQMEELLIGKIVEEEVPESGNTNEAKREMVDYGIGSFWGLGRRYDRRVKRDLGTQFIEEIKRIHQERMKKKRSKQKNRS